MFLCVIVLCAIVLCTVFLFSRNSLSVPVNFRQDGLYMVWDSVDPVTRWVEIQVYIQDNSTFHRTEMGWHTWTNAREFHRFYLRTNHSVWCSDVGRRINIRIQDGDRVRIRSVWYQPILGSGYFGRIRYSRWATVTFSEPPEWNEPCDCFECHMFHL